MADTIFPDLAGITWPITKKPKMSTIVQTSFSGKERRSQKWTYPIYTFKLSFEWLGDSITSPSTHDQIHTLMGFFLARQGSFDDFLFKDKSDYTVTNQVFGTGDGTTRSFQLIRAYGGYNEPVFGILTTPTIKIGSTATTAFTVNSMGLVTFTNAPANNATLSWSGSFYYRVRFAKDENDFEQFCQNIWEMKECELITLKF